MELDPYKQLTPYFNENFEKIRTAIDGIYDSDLLTLQIDKKAGEIISRYKITPPSINLDDLNPAIRTVQLKPEQMPHDAMVNDNRQMKFEVVEYNILFSGDEKLLDYVLRGTKPYVVSYERHYQTFQLVICTFDQISGNDKAIDKVNEKLIDAVNTIENEIKDVEKQTTDYHSKLKPEVERMLARRIEQAKRKKDSESRLNPFKK